jgi:hypothetical protein
VFCSNRSGVVAVNHNDDLHFLHGSHVVDTLQYSRLNDARKTDTAKLKSSSRHCFMKARKKMARVVSQHIS